MDSDFKSSFALDVDPGFDMGALSRSALGFVMGILSVFAMPPGWVSCGTPVVILE
jgi:hypothetical protein